MNQLISTLDLYFGKKAPQLPAGVKNIIVKIAPYLAVIGIIFSIPGILLMLGFSAVFQMSGYGMYGAAQGGWGLWAIFSIITLVLNVIAIPGLFKPSPKGWNFTFYAVLIGGLQNLLMMNFLGLVIGLVISFYILFQVRSYYFGGAHVTPPPPTM